MHEAAGRDECQNGKSGVVSDVDHEATADRIGYGADDGKSQSDQENNEYGAPGKSKLRGVQEAKSEGGEKNANNRSQPPRQYGIEKSAKE